MLKRYCSNYIVYRRLRTQRESFTALRNLVVFFQCAILFLGMLLFTRASIIANSLVRRKAGARVCECERARLKEGVSGCNSCTLSYNSLSSDVSRLSNKRRNKIFFSVFFISLISFGMHIHATDEVCALFWHGDLQWDASSGVAKFVRCTSVALKV